MNQYSIKLVNTDRQWTNKPPFTSTSQSNAFSVQRSFIRSWYTSNKSTWRYRINQLIFYTFIIMFFLHFIWPFCHTFAISIVRLMPFLMLSHDNAVPLTALNLQSPTNKNKSEHFFIFRKISGASVFSLLYYYYNIKIYM